MSAATAAAAAAAARRRAEEEEHLTAYNPSDLAENWEFKILRSSTSAFRDPVRFRQALDEEARAGWILVEKFDNQRLRLKRPASARAGDAALGVDPYRTTYGMSDTKLVIMIISIVVGIMVIIATIAIVANRGP